jgi:hypothetical protein
VCARMWEEERGRQRGEVESERVRVWVESESMGGLCHGLCQYLGQCLTLDLALCHGLGHGGR